MCIHMVDIFDNTILCKNCGKKMEKGHLEKNGFFLRTLICPKCNSKIIHPIDEEKYNRFINLKNKEFKVKMRLVGNSYAVSIPKEIVLFMNTQKKMMNDMVSLCFEEMDKLSLNFERLGGIKR
jgi:ssDNA-binding Zn-finger/Zn-ribbon topoisomerase 1